MYLLLSQAWLHACDGSLSIAAFWQENERWCAWPLRIAHVLDDRPEWGLTMQWLVPSWDDVPFDSEPQEPLW